MTVESAKHYRQLALKYRAFGFNLVPLGGDKRPVVTGVSTNGGLLRFRWDDWQAARQTDDLWAQIKKHEWWKDVAGLAAVCGPVSGDLVCVDFDVPKDTVQPFPWDLVQAFLSRLGAGSWLVDCPRGGFHVWVRCPGLVLDKGKCDRPALGLPDGFHIELRWIGHYAALPGSQHPSGLYAWHGDEPIDGPPCVNVGDLLAAYDGVTVQEPPKVIPLPAKPQPGNGGGWTNGAGKWARTAFDAELAELATVSANRNDALNKAAFALGSIVAGGGLDATEVEQALAGVAESIGLSAGEIAATIHSGMASGARSPRYPAEREEAPAGYEFGFVTDMPDPASLDVETTAEERRAAIDARAPKHHTWPYSVKDGRMVLLREDKDGDVVSTVIADFTVTIAEEIVSEEGGVHLVLSGHGVRRGAFRCEISGEDFGSDQRLLALLTAATGGIDAIYSGMHKHLRPAIGKLTEGERPQRTRYFRTGWQDDNCLSFLMPGMDDSTLISVPRQIAYEATKPGSDIDSGLAALVNLAEAMQPALTAPILAALFMPPMLRLAGLGNERVAIFIAGRTGSLKTSWAQTAMCLYGSGFASNDNLLKLGEGATRNAIMAFAAHAHDLPLLIDNYKPNTGNGKHDFVNLIHNILEGGDRKRSERSGALRDSKLIRCIPVVTGEDLPRDDAASIARILLVTFDWQRGEANERLTAAQQDSKHLCAVGWAWIQWLQSPDGRGAAKTAGRAFPRLRTEWAQRLAAIEKDSANIARVASNLAVNQLAWELVLEHPQIGPVLAPYAGAHFAGLRTIAHTMAKSTVEAMEAHQYRSALRELASSGQYKMLDKAAGKPGEHERDRVLGWKDSSGVYLLPAVTLAAIKRLLGPTQLLISAQTLYGQMQQLGWLAATGGSQTTRLVSIGSEKVRVLHLLPDFLDAVAEGDEALEEIGL